jgi:intracellular multiplication protein IcmG
MDNNSVNPSDNNDEEYHLTEEAGAQKYKASTSEVRSDVGDDKSRQRKKILVIIGIIIAIFCLYKLYGLFTASPIKAPLGRHPEIHNTVPAAPSVSEEQPKALSIQSPPVISEEKGMGAEETPNKIASLEQAIAQNGQAEENLQNQIAGLSSAITEIQNNIAMLTQQVGSLSQQKIPQTISKSKEKKAKSHEKIRKTLKKSVAAKKPIITPTNYNVKAMIQGRAWLISQSGATFTVSTGDELAGYGTIQDINPDKGVIVTSSGKVINYMPNDR